MLKIKAAIMQNYDSNGQANKQDKQDGDGLLLGLNNLHSQKVGRT